MTEQSCQAKKERDILNFAKCQGLIIQALESDRNLNGQKLRNYGVLVLNRR
jgi:hypothetical protein